MSQEFGVFFKVESLLHLPDARIESKMKEAELILNHHFGGNQKFTFMDYRKKPDNGN